MGRHSDACRDMFVLVVLGVAIGMGLITLLTYLGF